MADKKKLYSYMTSMQMEIVSEDDHTVKAVRIHGFYNEQMPVMLWCDLMQRFGQMTPGEAMTAIGSRQRTIEEQWEVMRELQRRGLVSTEDLEKVLWDVMKIKRPINEH